MHNFRRMRSLHVRKTMSSDPRHMLQREHRLPKAVAKMPSGLGELTPNSRPQRAVARHPPSPPPPALGTPALDFATELSKHLFGSHSASQPSTRKRRSGEENEQPASVKRTRSSDKATDESSGHRAPSSNASWRKKPAGVPTAAGPSRGEASEEPQPVIRTRSSDKAVSFAPAPAPAPAPAAVRSRPTGLASDDPNLAAILRHKPAAPPPKPPPPKPPEPSQRTQSSSWSSWSSMPVPRAAPAKAAPPQPANQPLRPTAAAAAPPPSSSGSVDGLPPGWTEEVREAPARSYKMYSGRSGESAQSKKEAWRKYEQTNGARAAPPPARSAAAPSRNVAPPPPPAMVALGQRALGQPLGLGARPSSSAASSSSSSSFSFSAPPAAAKAPPPQPRSVAAAATSSAPAVARPSPQPQPTPQPPPQAPPQAPPPQPKSRSSAAASGASSSADTSDSGDGAELPEGSEVVLTGLNQRAELNGKSGKVVAWVASLGRYSIRLDKAFLNKADKPIRLLNMLPNNLVPLLPT